MIFIYKIEDINIGKKLQYYRKMTKKTLLEVGNYIHKSKATVSKYENNQIIPDAITLLELCNYLDIPITDFFPVIKEENENSKSLFNPFETDKLFMYYYTNNKLMTSIIDIFISDTPYNCKFYNGIKDTATYQHCAYYYEGVFEANKTTAYFTLHNSSHKNNMLEKVQIVINIPWSDDIKVCKGLILGLTPNSLPIVKKIIVSCSEIKDIHKYDDALIFSKNDIKKIYYDGAFILENKNYDEFFFDF